MNSEKSMVITVMDRDRPGIVAEVTEAIGGLGGDLADLSQTVLCGYFTMILVAEFPPAVDAEQIERALATGGSSHVHVVCATDLPPEKTDSSHVYVLSAIGRNRIGLVARVSRFCFDRGVNILDLASHAENGLYTMMLQIDLAGIASIETFERELAAFGRHADLNIVLQHNDIFRATNEI